MTTKENKKNNVLKVLFEIDEDSFIVYDSKYNQLAIGGIFTSYNGETDYSSLDRVEVHENYVFENNKRVEDLISENFDKVINNIELTDTELDEYNTQYMNKEMKKELAKEFAKLKRIRNSKFRKSPLFR